MVFPIDLSMREIQTVSNPFIENSDADTDSLFDEIFSDPGLENSGFTTEIESDTEPKVNNLEMQKSVTEIGAGSIESAMGDTEIVRLPSKRKVRTGRQGSQGVYRNFINICEADHLQIICG